MTTFDLVDSSAKLSSEDGYNGIPRKQRRARYIIIAVVIGCVVGVAIGLAVGLSIKSDSSEGDQAAQGDGNKSKTTPSISPSTTIHSISPSPPSAQSSTHAPHTTTDQFDWLSTPCAKPTNATQCPWSQNPLILVSLDGFRADYLLRNLTPTLQRLRNCGVHTPYMRSVYPTLTFPNHYSIVTGLYPESHGIVGNSIYDPHINASFSIGSREKFNSAWWGGEPLWVTAKRQGRRTASYFWVGSEMNISGMQPDIWKRYDGRISFKERVDTVLEWLELPDAERPEFITLYFNEPDHQGHGHGPDSEQVNKALGGVDGTIRRLMDGLLRRNLDHCVNLIVLADHGMAETSCERQVDLDDYMEGVDDMLVYSGTTGYINTKYRKEGRVVYENTNVVPSKDVINSLQCKNPHLNIFSQSTIPTRHHYTNNERIGNVVLDIADTWLVYPTRRKRCLMGNHGYDNIYKSMHALFLAHGPDFKQNLGVEPFENIELYNLMTDILHLKPAPNNGTAGALGHILRKLSSPSVTPPPTTAMCAAPNTARSTGCACSNSVSLDPPGQSGVGVFPFGEPAIEIGEGSCILHGNRYSAVYSKTFKAPSMSSFSVTDVQVQNYSIEVNDCLIPDQRLLSEDDPDCVEYSDPSRDIDYVRLFDPGFSVSMVDKSEAQLSSNMVPMYNGFRDGIWAYVWRILKKYATKYHTIHVTVGPVYDYNFDGLLDTTPTNMTEYVNSTSSVPLPTHFYMILTKCSTPDKNLTNCSTDNIESLSFVLPHHNATNNCLKNQDFLLNNVARIRDIEHLTGLRFLTSYGHLPGARARTFLPLEMWPTLTM